MKIGTWTYDSYVNRVKRFHGSAAPGVILGGIMVQECLERLPAGIPLGAIVETKSCLPDAVQLLTPCTAGNGTMRVLDLGRFALCLFDRRTGKGIRAFVDPAEAALLEERDIDSLLDRIRGGGPRGLGTAPVTLKSRFVGTRGRGVLTACPLCGEGFPAHDGGVCRACQGETPYEEDPRAVQAAGKPVEHYAKGPEQVPEKEAAAAFAQAMAGEGIGFRVSPGGGRATLTAGTAGMLFVDEERLAAFNLVPGVLCASRHGGSVVSEKRVVAGTGTVSPYLPAADFREALALLSGAPLFRIRPLRPAKVGILAFGTGVSPGLAEARCLPILRNKVETFGCTVIKTVVAADDRAAIRRGVRDLLDAGTELLLTVGLSADPGDEAFQGLRDAGATDLLHGAPILPGGAIFLARIGSSRLIGVPAGAPFHRRTSFDLLLPRLLAGADPTRADLARFGHGGICLECHHCAFPKCPFGK